MNKLSKLLFIVLLIGLPLGGIWIAGQDPATHLEFPPVTKYVEHAPFSWLVFIGLALLILAVMVPFMIRIDRACSPSVPRTVHRTFPTWGWLSLLLGALFWLLAWTRFEWMKSMQLYTFTPIWVAYIVFINALTYRKTGRCLMISETGFFLKLFPLSAVFWWFFEYLNRFVQNWYYIGCEHFTPLQYLVAATLPFATVLPAVLSTEEWLAAYPRAAAGLQFRTPIRCSRPKALALVTLMVSATGLFFIGWFPDALFPLLWVAPLLLLLAFRTLEGGPSFFPEIGNGDGRRIYRFALAALICGFFWELWNSHSLAKWIYSIPYVHRFQLFEMPLLGYAGYLPFGLECAVIADLIRRRRTT
jgi:hypothetical protein